MRLALLLVVAACKFEHGAVAHDARPVVDGEIDAPSTEGCRVVEVAASSAHTCARKNDGTVACWGINTQGEAGKDPAGSEMCGTSKCLTSPNPVTLPAGATGLGAGDQGSCILVGNDTFCMGANDSGQFGDGVAGDHYAPTEITARAGSTMIAGSEASFCSLVGGSVICSGSNSHGEVGNGMMAPVYAPYTTIVTGASWLAMGYRNGCALTSGTVTCWGDNSERQIDTTKLARNTPTTVVGAPIAVEVTAGFGHICARQATGTVTCWGRNVEGQIGNGMMSALPADPTLVAITDVAQVRAGGYITCARKTTGDVYCWGEQYGTTPMQIPLPMPASSIAVGSYHGCAIVSDGKLWCWGWNAYGQFGNGMTDSTITPTPSQSSICP